jgi:2-iminoacetate synthase ThiH
VIEAPGPSSLAPWAWRDAGHLLVSPSGTRQAQPLRWHSSADLVTATLAVAPPAQPDPFLVLALLLHSWDGPDLQLLHEAAPAIHLEGDGLPLDAVLRRLRQAGLGSVPGTAVEVLSERRRRLCPEQLSARAWVVVVLQVHRIGLASTCTLMAGHIEQLADQAAMLRLTALARLVLGEWVPAHQPSWAKLGLHGAREDLNWGCNNLGETLMEEHITSMAGPRGGTAQTPAALQRPTLYGWS